MIGSREHVNHKISGITVMVVRNGKKHESSKTFANFETAVA